MPVTPLTLLKSQLNIDYTHDDALLAHKLAAAEEWIARQIGTDFPDPAPATLTEAALMLAAHWYEQREAVAFGEAGRAVPYGVGELVAGHKDRIAGHVVLEPEVLP